MAAICKCCAGHEEFQSNYRRIREVQLDQLERMGGASMSVIHALIRLHAPPTNHARTSTHNRRPPANLYMCFLKPVNFYWPQAFPYYRKLNINVLTLVWWDTGFMNAEMAIECKNVCMWCTVYGAKVFISTYVWYRVCSTKGNALQCHGICFELHMPFCCCMTVVYNMCWCARMCAFKVRMYMYVPFVCTPVHVHN